MGENLNTETSSTSKLPKRFIKSSVALHDRTQLETVFDYFLPAASKAPVTNSSDVTGRTVRVERTAAGKLPGIKSSENSATIGYEVETYLFYPRQFGVNEHTYPKERFYADVRPMLRFREPKMGFKTMVGSRFGGISPLLFLRNYLEGLASGRTVEPIQNAIDEVRLFACAYIGTYFRGIDRNRKRIHRLLATPGVPTSETIAKLCGRICRMVERADKAILEFREIRDLVISRSEHHLDALAEELRIADEYCYYRLRDGAAYLLQFHQKLSNQYCDPAIDALKAKILQVLAIHDSHAQVAGYMMLTPTSSNADKEKFIHRKGELKRRIWEVLFLEIRTVPLFAVQRQIGAMIAAGLAATWALIAQFLLIVRVSQPEALADGLGISGLVFLSAGILAYIIKDRIKEIGRGYFGGGVFRRMPDHSERIYYKNRSGKPTAVGEIKETAKFIHPEDLPFRITELRENTPEAHVYGTGGITRVLQYSKSIKLSGKLRILNRYPLRAVHDILRLNIDACLPKLGEPKRTIDLVTVDGEVEAVRFPKVYYLDMILSYSKLDQDGRKSQQALDYFRLVIDKNGLLRIERMN